MRTTTTGAGVAVLAILAAAWLLGLAAQRSIIVTTTYGDISPQLTLLGLTMFALGGAAIRLLAPARRRVRTGALAGVATLLAVLAGYAGLIAFYRDLFATHGAESGETWFSLLLESWFWLGIPLVVSAGLGAAGWLAADRLAGHGAARGGMTGRTGTGGTPTGRPGA